MARAQVKTQMEVSFARYVGQVLGRAGSVSHYATAVRTASKYLNEMGLIEGDLFEIESVDKLKDLRRVLYDNGGFIEQNSIGNNMYSVGLNHFVDFLGLKAEEGGRVLTTEELSLMDAPVQIPARMPRITYGWNRDRVVVEQVLKADKRKCEVDPTHHTFVTRRSGEMYLEGHHLIAVSKQEMFKFSLDVYANIIGLCPNCHRQMHYGRKEDIKAFLKPIYDQRAERLANSGIIVSKDEFLSLACA